MLDRPTSCRGCALEHLGAGFMAPQLGTNGVLLLGEALGKTEAEEGAAFVGPAGGRLTRLINWAGFDRRDFSIANAVWCQPPDNRLEGEPYESSAISHCRAAHWNRLLSGHKVIVPLGNVPTAALLGRKGILSIRGYVSEAAGSYVLPTVHPNFIQRGNSKWSAPFISDIRKAVELSRLGSLPPQFLDYLLDPVPAKALAWVDDFEVALRAGTVEALAFDIETPGKPDDEDEADTDSDAPDQTWNILRIGFSYRGHAAISIPWEPPFYGVVRRLLGSACPKVVWNQGFDVPRVQRAGFAVRGTIHDGMLAWHILHSDLPKRLGFVATMCCPWQPTWKHLSAKSPAFYNATDADVEWRCWRAIREELESTGLWEVYQRDVLDLQPVLSHMERRGLLIDSEVRRDRAYKLDDSLRGLLSELESLIPLEARKIAHVYKSVPKDTTGLLQRPARQILRVCDRCGAVKPPKAHFKHFVKKVNPCARGTIVEVEFPGVEFFRLADFKLSRDLLTRYHNHLKRPLPTVWDRKLGRRKVSFDEEQMKKLILAYPLDRLYPGVLEYRKLDKLASTYIGRPADRT